MRVSSIKLVTVGIAVAAGALLSACSGQNAGAPATTAAASPKNQAQQQPLQAQGKAAEPERRDVNCSANGGGKVGPHQVDLIVVETKAGMVGCTVAFSAITKYYENAHKAEGSGRFLTVGGWNCAADTGAEGTGVIACEKDGLTFHTGPVGKGGAPQGEGTGAGGAKVDSPEAKLRGTTQSVRLLRYDADADMVEFELVRWVPGGPNNGHFDKVPGDTYLLSLSRNVTVTSASALCPTGQVTVGNDGNGIGACSKARLLTVLKEGQGLLAKIRVNASNEISSVAETYTP